MSPLLLGLLAGLAWGLLALVFACWLGLTIALCDAAENT
jgi:hypothetical protein